MLVVFLMLVSTSYIATADEPTDFNSWGKIFSIEFNTDYEISYVGEQQYFMIFAEYDILGFGDHTISWEITFQICFDDNTWENKTIGGNDQLWFNLNPFHWIESFKNRHMPIKLRAHEKYRAIFPIEIKYASWTATLYVDSTQPYQILEDSFDFY